MQKYLIHEALRGDGGEAIFLHYGLPPSRQAQAHNPFREERSVSFYVSKGRGNYYYKDFGDDRFQGNALKFIQQYEEVDYAEALRIAGQIYNLTPNSKRRAGGKPKRKKAAPQKKQSEIHKELVSIQFRDFSPAELAFWWEKGQIDAALLERENIQALDSFRLRYTRQATGESWEKEWPGLQFCFAYEISPGKAYKLYQPKPALRSYAPHKTVYLPNLAPARALEPDYVYSLGLEELDSGQPVYLCGGEADYLALKVQGYSAFTLGAEQGRIPDYIQKKLQAKGLRVSDLIVLYDTDYAGLQASRRLGERYGCRRVILPKLTQQAEKHEPKPEANDLCDYLGLYGWDGDLEKALTRPLNPTLGAATLSGNTFQLQAGQYLSDLPPAFLQALLRHPRCLLQAPTGTGKTTFCIEQLARAWFAQDQIPTILAVPLNDIAIQKGEKHGVPYFISSTFHEHFVHKVHEKTPLLICNYDHVAKLTEALRKYHGLDRYNLIVDEQHELINGVGFRQAQVSEVWRSLQTAHRGLVMSATPFQIGWESWQPLRVEKSGSSAPVRILRTKQKLSKALLEAIHQQKIREPRTQVIALLNSKPEIEKLRRCLSQMHPGLRVEAIYNQESQKEENEIHQALMQSGQLPETVDVLLCTEKIATGIDIEVTGQAWMVYAENGAGFNPYLAEQFQNRIRNREALREFIILCRGEGEEEKRRTTDSAQAAYVHERIRWQRTAQIWQGAWPVGEEPPLPRVSLIRGRHTEAVNVLYEAGGKLRVNELYLMHRAWQREIQGGSAEAYYPEATVEMLAISSRTEGQMQSAQEQARAERARIEAEVIAYLACPVQRRRLAVSWCEVGKNPRLKGWLEGQWNLTQVPGIEGLSPTHLEKAKFAFAHLRRFARLGFTGEAGLKLIIQAKSFHTNKTLADRWEKLSLHYNRECLPPEKLDIRGRHDLRFWERVQADLEAEFLLQGSRGLAGSKIRGIVRRNHQAVYKTGEEISQTKAVQLAGILFQLKAKVGKDAERKSVRRYYARQVRTWASLCAEYGMPPGSEREFVYTFEAIDHVNTSLSQGVDRLADQILLQAPEKPCPF